MEALVKCGVVMVSIALGYQHIEQGNRTMNEPDYTRLTLLPPAQSGHPPEGGLSFSFTSSRMSAIGPPDRYPQQRRRQEKRT